MEPNFNDTIYSTLEEKLGRKLTKEENEKFYWISGMRKEWFYGALTKCETAGQAEQLFIQSILPTSVFFGWDKPQPKSKSVWSMLWEKLTRN